jgi:mannose-1-phosphate guanylyltransferase
VVLAAGFGTRLRPLSEHLPKPLFRFFHVPLVEWAIAHLVRAGVERVAVNLHHGAPRVAAHLQEVVPRRWPNLQLELSMEPEILGTGGALANLAGWLGREPFWILNSDAVFVEDLREVARAHEASQADATLMVTRDPRYAAERLVRVVPNGRVETILSAPDPSAATFCGIHLASRGLLERIPLRHCSVIREGYSPWLADGAQVLAYETRALFADMGTPDRFVDAHGLGLAVIDRLLPLIAPCT